MPAPDAARRCVTPAERRAAWRWNAALCGAAAVWVLLLGNPAERLERRWFDGVLRARDALGRTPPADPRVVILGIEDADFAQTPGLADEYREVAQILREAADLGAAAIVLDAIYARGTPAMAQPIVDAADGAPVVWAEAVQPIPGEPAGWRRLRSDPVRIARLKPAGLINISADSDGVHRSYPLLRPAGETLEPSLALAAWVAARGLNWQTDVQQSSPGRLHWQELSTDGARAEERRLDASPGKVRLLNYRGPWQNGAGFGHLNPRSLHALHESAGRGAVPLAGRILLVCNIATGIADLGATAFGPNEPLVLLHATAINDLLQGTAIRRAPRWGDALAFLLVALLGQAGGVCPRKRWLFGLWLAGLAVIAIGGLVAMLGAYWLVATVGTAALWTTLLVLELSRRHSHEAAERQHLRSSLGVYFPPRVLESVLANPGRLEPKRVEITVLLTDLRNSTPLAEQLGTEGMLALLNRVFEIENRAVFAEDGSLEKPVGDQFLAYWGAPDPQPDAADRAVRAAQQLIEGLEALRATLDPPIRELFGYGVALHAGSSLIANIGSTEFFHYGLVGDLINAAARVEALTKTYGVQALITREVLNKLASPPPSRFLDRVIVKGKSTPLELHELCATQAAAETVLAAYAQAFSLYERGRFAEAASRFDTLAPTDPPSLLLRTRCRELADDPPDDWEGVYRFETK